MVWTLAIYLQLKGCQVRILLLSPSFGVSELFSFQNCTRGDRYNLWNNLFGHLLLRWSKEDLVECKIPSPVYVSSAWVSLMSLALGYLNVSRTSWKIASS
jgi:hypothetical protein